MGRSKKPLHSKIVGMLQEIKDKVKAKEAIVNSIAIKILIWGPSPTGTCEVAACRIRIKEELTQLGHLASFSEDLIDPKSRYSIKIQQLWHAQEFDLIISLPTTHGAIGEIHDFISDNRLNKKMIIFLDSTYEYGYSHQSLVSTASQHTYSVISYRGTKELYKVEEAVCQAVLKLREINYLNQGQWL